jgi:hypothetical protein
VQLAPQLKERGISEIWMPCEEGSGSMDMFFRAQVGEGIGVKQLYPGMDPHGKVLIFDRAMCPFPGRTDLPAPCRGEILWESAWSKSYRVVRADCS